MEEIAGTAAIRRRLRTPAQADAARFELEVLKTFADAGLRPVIVGTPDCAISVRGQPWFVEIKQVQTATRRSLLLSLRAKARQMGVVAQTEFPCLIALDLRRFPEPEAAGQCRAVQEFLSVTRPLNGVIAWLPGSVVVLTRTRRWVVSAELPLDRALRDLD